MAVTEPAPAADDVRPFAHVIVPFDGSADAQRAALAGADAAAQMGAELVVATIGDVAGDMDSALKQRAVRLSDEHATMWVEPGHSAVRALDTMVGFRPSALLCMYTHARTGVLHAVYGNLTDQLLDQVDAPLLLLGPRCQEPRLAAARHLIVCVDQSEGSHVAVELATRWAAPTAPNATVVYGYDRDEIVANVDEVIAPLTRQCPIVEKVATQRANLEGTVLDIVRHSTNSIVVTSWNPSSGFGRRRHDPFLSQLSLQSPVPVLVQRARGSRKDKR